MPAHRPAYLSRLSARRTVASERASEGKLRLRLRLMAGEAAHSLESRSDQGSVGRVGRVVRLA